MPSIINSDDGQTSGSAGLKFTSGDDGVMKIQNNGVDAMTVSDAGVTTFASQPVVPVPAFRAYLDTSQNINSNEVTVVQINNKTDDGYYDTEGWFNTSTYRYVPQVAGYYLFMGTVRCGGASQTQQAAWLLKNGENYVLGQNNRDSTSSQTGVVVTSTAYMNGTTDYMQLAGVIVATSPSFVSTNTGSTCVFEGFLVRAA